MTTVLVASLMAKHIIAFEGWDGASLPPTNGEWTLTHVLGSGCECSKTVAEKLASRGKSEFAERVLLIDMNDGVLSDRLEKLGFQVFHLSSKQIKDERIHAVPSLVVQDPQGALVYSGGYTGHKVGRDSELADLKIARILKADRREVEPLAVFGCVVSQRYRNLLNPWMLVGDTK